MKIRQHPRMQGIAVGDEVYSYPRQLLARVEETFPAAVCVKLGILSVKQCQPLELVLSPQLWRADDIENLSVCRYCGARGDLRTEPDTGVPFRICYACSLGIHADEHALESTPRPRPHSAPESHPDGSNPRP